MSAVVFFQDVNELATLTNTFSVLSLATDPTTISLIITDPTGTATTYTYGAAQITRTGTGVYTKDIPCTVAGDWQYEWIGTGACSDSVVGTWRVFDATANRQYVTIDALKARLGIPSSDSNDDYQLRVAAMAASRAIETHTQRHFWRTPANTIRTFVPTWTNKLRLPEFCDVVSIDTLKTDTAGTGVTYATTWLTSDYQLLPQNLDAAPETQPYDEIRALGFKLFPFNTLHPYTIQIAATWGWPAVPFAVKEATAILAAEMFKLKDAPGGGVAGMSEFGVVTIRQNPQIAWNVNPYCRGEALWKLG